jgi:uncharacterized repeat protein (TIGR03803 family)
MQMKDLSFGRFALSIGVAAALLPACGGSQSPIGAPGVMPQSSASTARADSKGYAVVYSFGAPPDGANPSASVIDVSGILYGTTSGGGSDSQCNIDFFQGCGTVFSLTAGGTERVLHNFTAQPDGANPIAPLVSVNGTLYGTTMLGGSGDGTAFSITTSGTENVLHSFDGSDGIWPSAAFIDVQGVLDSTTQRGGGGRGTIFSLTISGTEKVLHRFVRGRQGAAPVAGVIDVDGTLYGTTVDGGAHHAGTVFSITANGKEKVLHAFGIGTDGAAPFASLIDMNGTLYGTTERGGAYSCAGYGCGTVFSITPSGSETVLHSFGSEGDGSAPVASLIDLHGTLYGTTVRGGAYSCAGYGCGTVFSITPSGTEKVLHSFGSGATDGAYPEAALIEVKGSFYGTTDEGGTNGNGTVFVFSP